MKGLSVLALVVVVVFILTPTSVAYPGGRMAVAVPASPLPWLEHIHGIADPIPPVTPDDTRPSVKELIAQHQECISQVRFLLQDDPLFHPERHDDLWILRFVLSHKGRAKKAARAAKATLAYRKEYQLDATDLRHCNVHDETSSPAVQRFLRFCDSNTVRYVIPDAARGVIGFYKLSGLDQHWLVRDLDETDWEETFRFISEWIFQWNDYITRTTGRLTKSIRVMDISDIPISNISYECAKRVAKAATVMEEFYPQNLQSAFICEAPSWAEVPWRMIRPFVPKRLVEKLDFVSPGQRERDRMRLLQHIALEHLPTRYGGKWNEWPVAFQLPNIAKQAATALGQN